MAASEKASADSDAAFQKSRAATAGIVFGQPIIVGHHSEGKHRAALDKSWAQMGKSVALSEKSTHYAEKAASVGTGGISGDDPEAVKKLQLKLAGLETAQQTMVSVNKILRKHSTREGRIAGLIALGLSEAHVVETLTPNCFNRIGYASYALQNNNANINATKKRIEALQKLAKREAVTSQGQGYEYREDLEDNRICFIFEGKPTEAIRDILKARAFKWSPTRGAWVRQITNNALYAAKEIKAKLDEVQS